MDRWVGKVAVVTGASAGIGEAIVENLVGQGLKVAALARRKDRLDALAKKLAGKKGEVFPIQADIGKEEDILHAFKLVKENLGPVHILINNAGVMPLERLHDGSTEVFENTINVNVIGLCIATREAIKDMKANKVDGHIIHMNSMAGHQLSYFPGLNIYCGSKFAVTALAETLRLELNSLKSKIKITSISPGPTLTELIKTTPEQQKALTRGGILLAEDIADGVSYVLSTPPHVQIQELMIQPVLFEGPKEEE